MSKQRLLNLELEPERYELAADPAYRFTLDRRQFIKLFGSGVVVVCAAGPAWPQESGRGGRAPRNPDLPDAIAAWLHIGEDGRVTVYTGKVEVGQNIRTSLAQAVAEELRVPVGSIVLVMGDTDRTPYDMGTFGSRTTPNMAKQLHEAAAAAREALVEMAASRWKVAPAELTAENSQVVNRASGERIAFGELTKGQRLVKTIGPSAAVSNPEKWTVCGSPVEKVNASDAVTGRLRFTSDLKKPDMLYGKVLRPSAYGAKLASLDASAAKRLLGVTVVHDGDFAGVTATSTEQASAALKAFKAQWKPTTQPSSKEIFDYLKQNPDPDAGSGFRGRASHESGSVEQGLASAHKVLTRAYTVAYIAHVPLETRAALAEWSDGKLTVWTGTQRPFGVRDELMEAFHLPEERVRVIFTDTGSAYGGKHTGEAAIEAARLARAAGKPVKVTWTREEEFTSAYFRPAGVIEVKSGVAKDGRLLAWEFHNYNSGAAGIHPVYEIPNQRIQFHPARSPLKQGSYRALAATANHFARETQIDEMAAELSLDPLEFRLRNLKDERMRAVLEAAAKAFGWQGRERRKDRGYGIAAGFEKASYVAGCAEIAIDGASGAVRVTRFTTAYECGAIVNPNGLKNQVEGAVIQGLGGALFEAMEFDNSRLLNPRLAHYRVPRFSDVPKLDTVLLNRKDIPSAGAGETPIVCVAPAIGSAIFDATGVRLRSLPLVPKGLQNFNASAV